MAKKNGKQATEKQITKVVFMGCVFYIGQTAKFDRDFETARAILEKDPEAITKPERIRLLKIYRPGKHETGKIEGITSYDSSSTNCGFCQLARHAAENNTLHICGMCYDKAQEESYKGLNLINRHSLNMLIMSTLRYTEAELMVIDCTKINRVNSSGDCPNQIYAENMLNLARVNSGMKFAFWAKHIKPVVDACDAVGKPENMTLVQSSCIIGQRVKLARYFDYTFTVYPTAEAVAEAVAAGAGECNGKKCMACGYKCYLNGWKVGQDIAELLRVNKTRRAEIVAAIAARKARA